MMAGENSGQENEDGANSSSRSEEKNNSSHSDDEAAANVEGRRCCCMNCCRCFPAPALFSKTSLVILMMLYFIVAITTSVILTNQNYNNTHVNDWMMMGGITDNGATFRIRRRQQQQQQTGERFIISTQPDLLQTDAVVFEQELSEITSTEEESTTSYDVESITVSDVLESSTEYHYGTVTTADDDEVVVLRQGRFQTAPVPGQRSNNFKIATAGCAWTGSQAPVFQHIKDEEALFFLHLGDFHYQDITENSLQRRIEAIDQVLGSSAQADLFSSTALVYMWDDHDWLDNNSGAAGEGREAALESYRVAFPYYAPLPSNSSGAVYHAFTIGTVRFVVSDLRSEATSESIYSQEQRNWLFDEISRADQYDFLVWVTTKPWIGQAKQGDDSWFGVPQDRQELSEWISETVGATSQNLIAIASDAHMLAFDDGSNTDYSISKDNADTTTTANNTTTLSFPLLQSGPLDRLGSAKGGPFSDGCTTYAYERNHQYSVIEFIGDDDDQGEPCLEIKSYRITHPSQKKQEIISQRLCGKIFSESRKNEGSCEEPMFSTTNMALIATAGCLLAMVIVQSCFLGEGIRGGFLVSLIVLVLFGLTVLTAFSIPFAKGVKQFETYALSLIGLLQVASVVIYLMFWIKVGNRKQQ